MLISALQLHHPLPAPMTVRSSLISRVTPQLMRGQNSSSTTTKYGSSRRGLLRARCCHIVPRELPMGLQRELMPNHVAISIDGHSKWARERGVSIPVRYEVGFRLVEDIIRLSLKWGINVLTIFAFSTKNWGRPKAEVEVIMSAFETLIKNILRDDFLRQSIRICIIGDLSKLPKSLQNVCKEAKESTENNAQFDFILAISYGGQNDIVQACKSISQKAIQGLIEPTKIDESMIAEELYTSCITKFHSPDLVIRTGGEIRLSDFCLWDLAYSELYFTKVFWPDFKEADYVEALIAYQKRQRNFGERIA